LLRRAIIGEPTLRRLRPANHESLMMPTPKGEAIRLIPFLLAALLSNACGGWRESSQSRSQSVPAAAAMPSDAEASELTIRFLEQRVKGDPDDFIAHNKLGGYYLQRLRETGNLTYLDLAFRTARASLAALSAEQNVGGLALLAQAEYAAHNFAAARDHALRLTKLAPGKSYPYQTLGDALLELGDYDQAADAFRHLERLSRGSVYTETRLARLASLRGETQAAERHYHKALAAALELIPAARETVAWCRWQLGETAFARGDYETAERHYQDALTTFPDYFRALASLGRVRAARGDLAAAIAHYERAVQIVPELHLVAALGDLYQLAGRAKEAAAQYALVEQIARLSALHGALYNRQLALFYADHDLKAEAAYRHAAQEYEARRDIYGADALAWTALKAGRLAEAQTAIIDALRLGTRDARLYHHAGLIYHARGDRSQAVKYLKLALELNPGFDARQAEIARRTLQALSNSHQGGQP
jgi:tetratricopeptide (TPR) repeat protein